MALSHLYTATIIVALLQNYDDHQTLFLAS
jgi:hypothetical protein